MRSFTKCCINLIIKQKHSFLQELENVYIPISPQQILGFLAVIYTDIFPVISQQSRNIAVECYDKRAQSLVYRCGKRWQRSRLEASSVQFAIGWPTVGQCSRLWTEIENVNRRNSKRNSDLRRPPHHFALSVFMALLLGLLSNLLGLLLVITSLWH